MSNPIPKGKNAFTYRPAAAFTDAERKRMEMSSRSQARGKEQAKRNKGRAVYGLNDNPDNAPPEYKR